MFYQKQKLVTKIYYIYFIKEVRPMLLLLYDHKYPVILCLIHHYFAGENSFRFIMITLHNQSKKDLMKCMSLY